MSEPGAKGIVSRKAAEIGFVMLLLCFGAAIIIGALELETGWGSSGPEAGYFPLRIGILIVAAALAVVATEALKNSGVSLLEQKAAANMAWFALPLIVLVAAIPWVGLYIAAAAYLVVTIRWIGRCGWRIALGVGALAPSALFVLFEMVFRTPLPKGPLGPLLGML